MLKDRKTDHRQTDRWTYRHGPTDNTHTRPDRQTDRYRQTYIKTETDTDRQTYTAR